MKIPCPNCGLSCEVLVEEATGRKVGYCDPNIQTDGKAGCDTSFEINKGKAKQSDAAKGLFVKITEDMSYLQKRIETMEGTLYGKKNPSGSAGFIWEGGFFNGKSDNPAAKK